MEIKSYFEAFGATIDASEIASKGGLSYIAAATAMRLSGRPEATFVEFNGKPFLEMLGGSLVAVDLKIPGTEKSQRMYLPVMDRDNTTLAFGKTTLTDINNSRQRCLVKAIAAVYGDGMSIFMGHDGDGAKAIKALGVNPDSDLASVTPVISTLKDGGAPYIEWNVGLAACRITDSTFSWDVVMWDGLPFRNILGGLMVDVDTVYDGFTQRLSLPIMDSAHNPMGPDKATVFDWNKTVMRALTKCIAFNTGYGLGVYADEFGKDDSEAKKARKSTPAKESPKSEVKAEAKAEAVETTKVTTTAEAPAAVAASTSAEPQGDAVVDTTTAPVATTVPVQAEKAVEQPADPVVASAETAAAPAVVEKAEVSTASTASAADVAEPDAVTRFRDVMRKRNDSAGVVGLLTLFEALKTSTKFSDADKPACYAALVAATAAQVDAASIQEMLGNLVVYKAMPFVAADSRDLIGAKLTAVTLETALPQGDEALDNAQLDLISAGVAVDLADVLRLAALGNVPQATIDLVRDVAELAAA